MIEEAKSYLPEIEANLRRLEQSPRDRDALETAYRLTHLIGSAASRRHFRGLASLAHGMEDLLGDMLDGRVMSDVPTIELLRRQLRRLARILWGMQAGINEEALILAADDADYRQYCLSQGTK